MHALTPARKQQLESLKHRLRIQMFEHEDDPVRVERIGKLLRTVRERLIADEAPERRAAEIRARAETRARMAFVSEATARDANKPSTEHEAHARVADLAGGVEKAFRLLDIYTRTNPRRGMHEEQSHFEARKKEAFALAARREGYSPEACCALLGVQR